MTKVCTKCGTDLPLSEFFRRAASIDGYQPCCKRCQVAYKREFYRDPKFGEERRAKKMETERAWLAQPGHREEQVQTVLRYRARNPEKRLARMKVTYALKTGKLKRGKCEIPGCKRRAQAHHDDYSKPLEVRWRCQLHHSLIHYPSEPPPAPAAPCS